MKAYNLVLIFILFLFLVITRPVYAEVDVDISADITHKFVSHYQTNLCLGINNIPIDSNFCKAHFLYGTNFEKDTKIGSYASSYFQLDFEAEYSILNQYNDNFSYGFGGSVTKSVDNEFSYTSHISFLSTGVELFLGQVNLFKLNKVYLASNNFIERSFSEVSYIAKSSKSRSTNNLGYADSSLAPKNMSMETVETDALTILLITEPINGFKLGFGYDNRQVIKKNRKNESAIDHKLTFFLDYETNTKKNKFLLASILTTKINNDFDADNFPSKYDDVSLLLNLGFRSGGFETGLSTLVNFDAYNPEGRIKCSFRNGAPIESFCLPSIALRLSFILPTKYFRFESAVFVGFTPGVLFRNYIGHPEDSKINVHGFDIFYKIGSSISKELFTGFEVFLDNYYFYDQTTVDASKTLLSKYSQSSGFYLSLGCNISF